MANINIPDSALFQAGAGPDLKITHDGSNSTISNATGTLTINNIANSSMILGTNNTTAVTISNGQDVTMVGNIIMADDTSIGIADDAERIEFDGAGDISVMGANFGVGLLAPSEKVEIKDTTTSNTTLFLNNDNADGDPSIKMYTNSTEWALGIDNSASDVFKISEDQALGTKDILVLDPNSKISLSNNDSGGTGGSGSTSGNTLFGYLAGTAIASGGVDNTLVGHAAGTAMTTGDRNTAIGVKTMDALTVGSDNLAIGYDTMGAASTDAACDNNIAIGNYSMDGFTSQSPANNVAIGKSTMSGALTDDADNNVAVGHLALTALTSGYANVGIGRSALASSTAAAGVVALGYNTCGDSNVTAAAIGTVAVGTSALAALTEGQGNVAIGYQTLDATDDNDFNVAVGHQALTEQNGAAGTTANTAIGYQAGSGLTSATGVTAIGYKAGGSATMTGALNTLVGTQAGTALIGGDSNTIIGADSGVALTTGADNVIIGVAAGDLMTTTSNCTLIGKNAGGAMSAGQTTTNGTICIGAQSGSAIASGVGNVAIGYQSLDATATGEANTIVGYQAGTDLADGSDGNTAVGYRALFSGNNDSTHHNTGIGYRAGQGISTGFNNTMIGANVDVDTGSYDNVTAIGNNFEATQDDTVFLGNAATEEVWMAVDKGATVHCAGLRVAAVAGGGYPISIMENAVDDTEGATFQFRKSHSETVGANSIVANNDQLGNLTWYASDANSWERTGVIQCLIDGTVGNDDLPTEMLFGVAADGAATTTTRLTIAPAGTVSGDLNDTSDVALKENINTIEAGLTIVNQFNPVTFDWKQGSRGSNSGFIAQEIEKILPNDVCGKDYIEPEEGEQAENMGKSINVTGIVAHLVKAVQELSAKVEALENA